MTHTTLTALATEILQHEGTAAYGLEALTVAEAIDTLATWLDQNPDDWTPAGEDHACAIHTNGLEAQLVELAISLGFVPAELDLSGGARPAFVHWIVEDGGGELTVLAATADAEAALDAYESVMDFNDYVVGDDVAEVTVTVYCGDARRDVDLRRA